MVDFGWMFLALCITCFDCMQDVGSEKLLVFGCSVGCEGVEGRRWR